MTHEYSQQFDLVLNLRVRQLHANNLTGVSRDDLKRMVINFVWRKKRPVRISDMVNDILNIKDEEVVRWLASESRINGYKSSLSDYTYLFTDEE